MQDNKIFTNHILDCFTDSTDSNNSDYSNNYIIAWFKNIENKKECPKGYVSIYEVIRRHNKKYEEFDQRESRLIESIKNKTSNSMVESNKKIHIYVKNFDYNKNIMKIGVRENEDEAFINIIKDNNDLMIMDADDHKKRRVSTIYHDNLSALYDLYKNNESYIQDRIGNRIVGEQLGKTMTEFYLDRFGYSLSPSLSNKKIIKDTWFDKFIFIGMEDALWLQFAEYFKAHADSIFSGLHIEVYKLPRYMKEDIALEEEQRKQQEKLEEQRQIERNRKIENQRFLEEQEVFKEQNRIEEKTRNKEERKVKRKNFVNKFGILNKR